MDVNEELKLLWKCKMQKNGGGGQGGCEQRIEDIVKMQKKVGVGVSG